MGADDLDKFKKNILEMNRDWVSDLVSNTKHAGVEVSTTLNWCERQYKGVLEQAQERSADMIVKAAHVRGRLAEVVHTPDDGHLMLEAQCPVLLRLREPPPPHPVVVAAVNMLEDDEAHHALHVRVLNQAVSMALYNARLHVVNAVLQYPTKYPTVFLVVF